MTVAGQPQVTYGYDNSDRVTQIANQTAIVTCAYDGAGRRKILGLPNVTSSTYATTTTPSSPGSPTPWLHPRLETSPTATTPRAMGRGSGSFARTGLPTAVSTTTYNANNQLTKVAKGATTLGTFTYDGIGRRAKRIAGGTTTEYLYDGLNSVQEKSGNTVTANLLTGLGVDEYLSLTDPTGARHFLKDAVNSTVALTDGAGATKTEYTYEPFGKQPSQAPQTRIRINSEADRTTEGPASTSMPGYMHNQAFNDTRLRGLLCPISGS